MYYSSMNKKSLEIKRREACDRKRKQRTKQRTDYKFVQKEKQMNHEVYLKRKSEGKIKGIFCRTLGMKK